MAEKTVETTSVGQVEETAAKKTTKTAAKKAEPKFSISKIRANCMRLFSCTVSTFDGAFYGVEDTEMSVEDARAVLNKWLGKEKK